MESNQKEDFNEAKNFLREKFNEIVEDGQIIGMRNLKMSFIAWAEKMRNDSGNQNYTFSEDEISNFMTTFIEQMELKISDSRKDESK